MQSKQRNRLITGRTRQKVMLRNKTDRDMLSLLWAHRTAVNVKKPLNTRESMTDSILTSHFSFYKYHGIFTLRWWPCRWKIRNDSQGSKHQILKTQCGFVRELCSVMFITKMYGKMCTVNFSLKCFWNQRWQFLFKEIVM